MLWNKKRYEGMQTFKLKGKAEYMLVDLKSTDWKRGITDYEAIAPVFLEPDKADRIDLCTTSVNNRSLYVQYYPVSQSKIPAKWQAAFEPYMQ